MSRRPNIIMILADDLGYSELGCYGNGFNETPRLDHLATQLEVIDQGVGMISDKLDELGLADDSIFLFTSDNGGECNITTNAPLRGGKSELYEGGIREPFIIRWPGQIPAGVVNTQPIITMDLYPTFLEMLHIAPDPKQHLDGISLANLLQGQCETLPRESLHWYYPLAEKHFLGGRSSNVIRKGDYKLIEFFDGGTDELYNLADDLGEQNDLAPTHPELVAELKTDLHAWRHDVGARGVHGAAG